MLAYRHAFHAGNHADVFKHLVLTQVLQYMTAKDKPFMFIDTHAGGGGYALTGRHAVQGQGEHEPEYLQGIARIWERDDLPAAVNALVEQIHSFNQSGALRWYPGSPALAAKNVRSKDALRFFELHPTEIEHLGRQFHEQLNAEVHHADGFGALRALLPPPSRRAVVLMDPPYELRADYGLVIASVREALKRFAECVLIVWYPHVARVEARQMPQRLKACAPKGWLHAQLSVRGPAEDGFGLVGSGVFVFNPPWTLHDTLKETLPWLTEAMAQEAGANWLLEQHAV